MTDFHGTYVKGARTEQYPCNRSYHNSCDNTSTSDHTRAVNDNTMMDGITIQLDTRQFFPYPHVTMEGGYAKM